MFAVATTLQHRPLPDLPGANVRLADVPVRVATVRLMAVSGPGERADRGFPTLVIAAACLLAAAPLLNLAVRVLAGPALAWSGDQALVELGVREASALHRSLGVYSRFGWNHFGPMWLYVLALPYWLLGADGRALGAAVALLHAMTAVLIVGCAARLPPASRRSGAACGAAAAVAVLVLVHAFGRGALLSPWNPYAVILPALLFLLLAAGVLLGRRGWAVGAAAAATFLVQTHLGTVPLVLVVGGPVLLLRLAAGVHTRRSANPEGARAAAGGLRRQHQKPWPALPTTGVGRWQVAGWLFVSAAWAPPLLEQFLGSGNLGRIVTFATTSRHTTSWRASTSIAGQSLYRALLSHAPGRLEQALPLTGRLTTLTLLIAVGLLVAGAGHAVGEPVSRACGAVSVAAVLAGVLAAHQTVGAHDPYLLFWLTAAPGPLLVGASALLAELVRRATTDTRGAATSPRRRPRVLAVAQPAGGIALAACGIFLASQQFGQAPDRLSASNSRTVSAEVAAVQRWRGPHRGALLIRVVSHHLWPQVAGLLVGLQAHGQPTFVTANWVPVFGTHQALRRPAVLVLDASASAALHPPAPAGMQLGASRFGSMHLTLTRVTVPGAPIAVPPEQP